MPHLFADISAHGLGHLAQSAPVLNALGQRMPDLRLTVCSGLPLETLRQRLRLPFVHLAQSSDIGFLMHDALRIDRPASAAAYRRLHADWAGRVRTEAAHLAAIAPDLVLTDVAYLPLAAARQAGIPSIAMCSLNWAGLFHHVFAGEAWAEPIYHQILAAYRSTECFLRLTPAMPMPELDNARSMATVVASGHNQRAEINARLHRPAEEKLLLAAFGGFDPQQMSALCPLTPGVHWLVPANWPHHRTDLSPLDALDLPFADVLCSVDAILTKPGYGTFTEAACNGTAVLYLRRDDWPEQECLIEWLQQYARCIEIEPHEFSGNALCVALQTLWQQEAKPAPPLHGAGEIAELLQRRLLAS